jgi:type II secretory pathway component PulF
MTLFIIALSSKFSDTAVLVLVLAALGLTMAGVVTLLCYLADVSVLRPIVDRLSMSRHRAQVMHLVATAISRELPIDVALTRLTAGWGAYPSGVVQRKLSRALKRINRGQEWQDAFRSAKLINGREARVLRTAQEVGNLPWTLRFLAGRRLRLLTFRWATIQHIVFTIIVLALGAFVMLFCVAMFVPIIDLINNLSR